MMPEAFESVYYVLGRDYANAGKVSTQIKDTLKRLGIHPAVVRRVAIDSYEAEMNLVMYATRGPLLLNVSSEAITLRVEDEGRNSGYRPGHAGRLVHRHSRDAGDGIWRRDGVAEYTEKRG
jgi:anti-sigma regulatory factor (Ser/Thr protein kinase)